MTNVFSVRTETLELAAYKPYKFQSSKLCQLGCKDKIEDIKHTMNCKFQQPEEDNKLNIVNIEDFNNAMNIDMKININKLISVLEKRENKIRIKHQISARGSGPGLGG